MQEEKSEQKSTPARGVEKPNVYVIEGSGEEGSDKWPSMNEAAEESSEKEPLKYSPPPAVEASEHSEPEEKVEQIVPQPASEENEEMGSEEGEEEDGEYIPRSSSEQSKDHIIDEDHESEQFMIVRQSKENSQHEDVDMNDEFKESDWAGAGDELEEEKMPIQPTSPSPNKPASKA